MNDGRRSEHFYWNAQISTVFLYTKNTVIPVVYGVLCVCIVFGHRFCKKLKISESKIKSYDF